MVPRSEFYLFVRKQLISDNGLTLKNKYVRSCAFVCSCCVRVVFSLFSLFSLLPLLLTLLERSSTTGCTASLWIELDGESWKGREKGEGRRTGVNELTSWTIGVGAKAVDFAPISR